MDWDFKNSVILGYGPTEELHCQACKGNRKQTLSKGFAFYCLDNTRNQEFIAGSECRTKIDHDKRKLSAIPHFGAAKPIPEKADREGGGNGLRACFIQANKDEALIADMSAWVQLRQRRLPALGFSRIAYETLNKFMLSINENRFAVVDAMDVKRTYNSITRTKPRWALENLQKCHDVAMQIARVKINPDTSARNKEFLMGIRVYTYR